MISQRTKEALARKKQEGVKIGRPRALKYRKLDVYADYIKQSIQNKIPLSAICRKVGCNWSTLRRWAKENGVKTYGRNVKLEPRKNKTICYSVDYSKSYVEQVNKSLVCVN
jgi:DNA invertase Pin-like site-specific DNA recombinase